ncbi:MAG: VOC family protein [Chloroflexi bacterium]|nr:VOC family protein [Chloroflexota bacterium]
MLLKETHGAISVKDMDKSLAFYRDLLGMKVRRDSGPGPRPPDPFMDKLFGLSGVSLHRVVQLETGDAYVLELIQWHAPTPRPFPTEMRPCDLGFRSQCFYDTDSDSLYQRLKTAGVRFISEPVDAGRWKSVFVLDPDGNWIEIRPAPKP